jgi:hypothetical protein
VAIERSNPPVPEWQDPDGSSIPIDLKDILRAVGIADSEADAIANELRGFEQMRALSSVSGVERGGGVAVGMLKTLLATLALGLGMSSIGSAAVPNNVVSASGKLLPGYSIARRISGYCWTTSNISTSSADWRCMQGNFIYDPCYAASHSAHVVNCMQSPGSKKLLAMTLTKPLQ